MKRRLIIPIVLVCVAVTLAFVLHRPRMLPLDQCSEVYRHYCKADGIDATFIKDYDLGDSIAVDVTVLTATDSVGWLRLTTDFNIQTEKIEQLMSITSTSVTSALFPKGQYDQPADTALTANDLLLLYYSQRTFYIFELRSEEQFAAIMRYKYRNTNHENLTIN